MFYLEDPGRAILASFNSKDAARQDAEKRWPGCQFEVQPAYTCRDKALVAPETEVFRGDEILGYITRYPNG